MKKKYKLSVFLFHRDLRLDDNTGLLAALEQSDWVIPAFIFDPRQLTNNPYKSNNAIEFMFHSLEELDSNLRKNRSGLCCWEDNPIKILATLIKRDNVEAIFSNRDYTPFALQRDRDIANLCSQLNVACHLFDDALLCPPGSILKADGKPYTVFGAFFKKALLCDIPAPRANKLKNYYRTPPKTSKSLSTFHIVKHPNKNLLLHGGAKKAQRLLSRLTKLENYAESRNLPAQEGTSLLSPHHKFGTISIRKTYHNAAKALGKTDPFVSELYWRDFFTHIAYHFPHVFEGAFYRYYDRIAWENDQTKFKAWCQGKTGFPLVDAGMRQLNQTGFMHNRVRMVAASFLTKDLHIDWRWGEKYFAQQLVDYDPAVNNGNWQWAASTGCDAQPYFRIFNPWLQQKRFDPDCSYVKLWLPELRNLSNKAIHRLFRDENSLAYPKPIVDHSEAKEIAEDLYLEAREQLHLNR